MKLFNELLSLLESAQHPDLNAVVSQALGLDSEVEEGSFSFDGKSKVLSFYVHSTVGTIDNSEITAEIEINVQLNLGNFDYYSDTGHTHGSSYPGYDGGVPEESFDVITDFTVNSAKANTKFYRFANQSGDMPAEFQQQHADKANQLVAKANAAFSDAKVMNTIVHSDDEAFESIAKNQDVVAMIPHPRGYED